jgi:hypothetical protein
MSSGTDDCAPRPSHVSITARGHSTRPAGPLSSQAWLSPGPSGSSDRSLTSAERVLSRLAGSGEFAAHAIFGKIEGGLEEGVECDGRGLGTGRLGNVRDLPRMAQSEVRQWLPGSVDRLFEAGGSDEVGACRASPTLCGRLPVFYSRFAGLSVPDVPRHEANETVLRLLAMPRGLRTTSSFVTYPGFRTYRPARGGRR